MDVGIEFSHYRVIEHIGRGGMADVWSARDQRLARTVAVKTIARNLSQDMDPVKLFEREAQTIAGLEHPHILPIYEFGDYSGQLFIVMRYVSGGSLEDVIEKGPLAVDEMLRVARAVGQALDYAHTSKVIHLDLKPSNILLDSYQSPYLADFGLATMLDPEGRAKNPGSGTLLYMAPEQLTSDHLDHRADIYSFAIMVYHMLTGQLPFDAAVPLAIKQLQSGGEMPDVTILRPSLPPTLNFVLRQATEVDIEKRAESMRELLTALEQVLGGNRATISFDPARMPTGTTGETRGYSTLPLDALISGPLDGLISKPVDKSGTALTPSTEALDDLVSGPVDRLISKTGEIKSSSMDALISGPIDGLISKPGGATKPVEIDDLLSGPVGDLVSRTGEIPKVAAPDERNLDDLISGPIDGLISKAGLRPEAPAESDALTPEAMARQEAEDIYSRARRVYQRGQGRFLLGVTDYILIADYYMKAAENGLELDDNGRQMLLRGALEYDYAVDYWWAQVDEDSRRWTALHALRSENAPARTRALEYLAQITDAEPPQIPRLVAQAMQVESHPAAELAAIKVLAARSPLPARNIPLWDKLGLWSSSDWRPAAYTPDIDALLAQKALDDTDPRVSELAARTIGRLRSEAAAQVIAERRNLGARGALRALALARDEANSLPASTGGGTRLYAWLANTWRRLTDNPLHTVWRYVSAVIFGVLAMGIYVYLSLSAGAGAQILLSEIWGRTVSTGLTFGIFLGLAVVAGDELPQRLRGFWKWWARALWAGLFGFLLGTLTWGAYNYLILNDPNVPWNVIAYAGIGFAAAFVVMNMLRLPGILSLAVTALGLYLPLYYVWDGYWNSSFSTSIIYFYEFGQVFSWLIPMVLVMALGVNLQALIKDVRSLMRYFRRNK